VREPAEDELDRWMAELADGERSAFDPLFRALHPRALRLARTRLGEGDAADAAQASLVKVFARASDFTPGRPVLPWFYALVANEVRAITRRRVVGGNEATEPVASDDPERALLERELALALDAAIASLDPASAEAIAALLDRPARPAIEGASFRKRVSRAYARLRLILGGLG